MFRRNQEGFVLGTRDNRGGRRVERALVDQTFELEHGSDQVPRIVHTGAWHSVVCAAHSHGISGGYTVRYNLWSNHAE
jgi:hypothetical protein